MHVCARKNKTRTEKKKQRTTPKKKAHLPKTARRELGAQHDRGARHNRAAHANDRAVGVVDGQRDVDDVAAAQARHAVEEGAAGAVAALPDHGGLGHARGARRVHVHEGIVWVALRDEAVRHRTCGGLRQQLLKVEEALGEGCLRLGPVCW